MSGQAATHEPRCNDNCHDGSHFLSGRVGAEQTPDIKALVAALREFIVQEVGADLPGMTAQAKRGADALAPVHAAAAARMGGEPVVTHSRNQSGIARESVGPYARAMTTRRQETGDRNRVAHASSTLTSARNLAALPLATMRARESSCQ